MPNEIPLNYDKQLKGIKTSSRLEIKPQHIVEVK